MQYAQIATIFNAAYNGQRNMMTPNVLDYGKRGQHLYEISTGRGISGQPIFGVTVLTVEGKRCGHLNDLFGSHDEALRHARNLPRVAASAE